MTKAILLLQDGTLFHGDAFGKVGTSFGELCFNTGMTGYQEIYTDPSYYGQIIINTSAHIGNYGTANIEQESDHPQVTGVIINNAAQYESRGNADLTLQEYFEANNTVAICNVDTRMLVKHIRSKGAMNAAISSDYNNLEELKQQLADVPSMDGLELSSVVSTKKSYEVGDPNAAYKVAVMDYGIKRSILGNFSERGVLCKVFPHNASLDEINDWDPDGFFLSNGPGDPAAMDYAIKFTRDLLATSKPIFGICLGHQLLALACDIPTYKLHQGHRGINHPVINYKTSLCEITSQNHGFSVNETEARNSGQVEVTHVNLNDHTVAGIKVKDKPAFSVQYHPESSPGPQDSRYLFDEFIAILKNS